MQAKRFVRSLFLIIFLTALVTEAEAKSGLKIDGHSFLAKPIKISELVGAIEQHLSHARKATSWK